MNRPKATRLRLFIALAAVTAFAAFMPAGASADFVGGTGVNVTLSDTTPGAHPDFTVTHSYAYGSTPTSPSSCGLPVAFPAACSDGFGRTGDDLKQWIIEAPVGLYGNPTVVPFAKRCTQDQMNGYVKNQPMPGYLGYPGTRCPDSSIVGTATLTLKDDPSNGIIATRTLNGTIYLVQSPSPLQEIPATLFTVFRTTAAPCSSISPGFECITAAISKTQFGPVAGGTAPNYRLRAVSEIIDRPDLSAAASLPDNTLTGQIAGIQQTLWGDLNTVSRLATRGGAGNEALGPLVTNPVTCSDWNSSLYARTYGSAGAVGSEAPVSTGSQTNTIEGTVSPGGGDTSGTYSKFDATPITPTNCENAPALTLAPSASVDNNARGANPGLTVNISNPGSDDADKAKKLVTTLPSTITINASALGNICQDADLQADTCPAASQVGTAEIATPLLGATQYGRVYMTKGATQGLPFLSIWVNGPSDSPAGAFKFRLDAKTQFVGQFADKIETTFDDLPPVPFDSFKVTINGGDKTNSLLLNRVCPGDGSTPEDGPITFATTGYTGAASSSQSATNLDPCYGVTEPANLVECQRVTKKLRVSPKNLVAQSTVDRVQLFVGSKPTSLRNRMTDRSAPFTFRMTLKKPTYKKNRTYFYAYKVTYKDGKVIKTKVGTFKTCK